MPSYFLKLKVMGATTDEETWNIIDYNGKRVRKSKSYKYVLVSNYSNYFLVKDKDSKWGTIDENGEEVISPEFDDMEYAMGDNILVCVDEKWGLCNSTGQVIANPQQGKYVTHAPSIALDQSYDPTEVEKLLETEIAKFSNKIYEGVTMEQLNSQLDLNLDLSKEYRNSEEIASIVFKRDEEVANGVKLTEWVAPSITSTRHGSYYYGYSKYSICGECMPNGFNVTLIYSIEKKKEYEEMIQRVVKKYKMTKTVDSSAQYYVDSDGVNIELTYIEGSEDRLISLAISEGELCGITDEDYEELAADSLADSNDGGD